MGSEYQSLSIFETLSKYFSQIVYITQNKYTNVQNSTSENKDKDLFAIL